MYLCIRDWCKRRWKLLTIKVETDNMNTFDKINKEVKNIRQVENDSKKTL